MKMPWSRARSRQLILYRIEHLLTPRPKRVKLLRRIGHVIGKDVQIFPGLVVQGYGRLTIGDTSFINRDCILECGADVTLGAHVLLGHRVQIITTSHEMSSPSRRGGEPYSRPVIIGAGSWLGCNVTVLPGVTIGKGTVIGAGTLVLSDCDANSVYVGTPARKVKSLETSDPI